MADALRRKSDVVHKELVLMLLAFASATTDVLSFLALSDVFTSGMTGNTALLGMAVGQGRALAASRSLAALLGFVLGVVAGTLARSPGDHPRKLAAVLAVEALCLGLFAGLWHGFDRPAGAGIVYALIFLSALGMGVQIIAARQVNLPGIPTIVFTSTIANVVMLATDAVVRRRAMPVDALRQSAVFAVYLAGAVLAGWLASRALGILVLLPLGAVLGALALQLRPSPAIS
ncbi:MAG TPA: YoaK family protein [Stellaceae bacterium]|nr:YoaK family protein [Stellaceae bacterium]